MTDLAEEPGEGLHSVLLRFVMGTSVSEKAALNFLDKVKEHYGFPYEPLYKIGDKERFDWNDKDKTKRGMARTYVIRGLPSEEEAKKFASNLETKVGIEWAYREVPIKIDDPGMGPDGSPGSQ